MDGAAYVVLMMISGRVSCLLSPSELGGGGTICGGGGGMICGGGGGTICGYV